MQRDFLGERLFDWDHIHFGRIARLRLPSPVIADAIVSIYVIHLEGESNSHQEQIDLVAELKRVLWDDESDLTLLVGDFNFAVTNTEDIDAASETPSRTHARLAHEFAAALPQFVAVSPHGYTYLTHFTGLGRCYVNIPLEALDMQGIECTSLPFGQFFGPKRPSDHLPIIMRSQPQPRPMVAPLARIHAHEDGWKELVRDELQYACFEDLHCKQATTMLPILLRTAPRRHRASCEQLDASNDELCLYYATRCLRCYVEGDVVAAMNIVHRAPHWRLQRLPKHALLNNLTQLVRTLRLRVWMARSQSMHSSVDGLDDVRDNKRAKVQRWAGIMAAWRGAFKQCTSRALLVDGVPVVEPLRIAQALAHDGHLYLVSRHHCL